MHILSANKAQPEDESERQATEVERYILELQTKLKCEQKYTIASNSLQDKV